MYISENKRLKEVIYYLKGQKIIRNQQDFVERINDHPSIVSEIKTGKRQLSENFVRKTCDVFRMINSEWLLKGEGEMLLCEEKTAPYSTDPNILIVANEPGTLLNNYEKLKCKIEYLEELLNRKDEKKDIEIARLNKEIGRLEQQLNGKKRDANCG